MFINIAKSDIFKDDDYKQKTLINASRTVNALSKTAKIPSQIATLLDLDMNENNRVKFNEINIRSIGESLNSEFYSPTTGATLSVPFDARIGNLPVKASVSGFLGRDGNGRNVFKVGSKDDIKSLSFKAIKDIKNIVLKYEETLSYDLLDTFAVSHVVKEAAKTIVYIQEKDRYEPDHYDLGLRIEVPSVVDIWQKCIIISPKCKRNHK